ncbi:MAG TPA: gamma-glutamyl-gamma-aminobutyrate hydrolase family protein [Conexibacter sp.]|nr:gamma-glutamyl-gamma-aminobutyrate hydrolase family protein [Conexibacter sp.]
MIRRPVIGICTPLERAQWSVWDQDAALLPTNYLEEIRRAGGMALLLAPDPALTADPDEALDLVDGLMLAGGADIDPASYGAVPDPRTVDPVPERDAFEVALTRRTIERGIPFLGICRGMQLLNVALGGTLHQHLPERFGHHDHLKARGSFDGADHDVQLEAGSLAARAAGELLHGTKSHHHQGVDRIGEGLVVTGHAVIDDLPEALELPDAAGYVLGVQWHPEADRRSGVIGALVSAARAYASGSATTASSSTSASRGRPAAASATRAGGSVSKNDA